jgi:MFS family permease
MAGQTVRKILTHDFILVFLAQFAFISAYYILVPTLPIYLSKLGSQEAEIGLLIGIFFVTALVLRPFVGKALLRIPEITFMIAGALLFALTSFGFLFAPPFWPFFITRAIQGVGLAFFHTASYTLVVNISPEAHRGQSLSYFLLAPNISLALIPSLGMFLINHFSFTFLFLVCFGISLCSLGITSRLERRRIAPQEDSPVEKGLLISWKALPPSVVSFFNFIMWGALITFFPLYALNHGVANSGLFFTVIAIMFFLGRAFGGKILDLYRSERAIPPMLATCVISMVLLPFSKNLPMFILVGVIWGVGNALLSPAVMSYALEQAGSSKGPAIGTYTLLSDLGLGLGPVIMGVIVHLSNYSIMFFCLASAGVINIIYFYLFVRKRRPC